MANHIKLDHSQVLELYRAVKMYMQGGVPFTKACKNAAITFKVHETTARRICMFPRRYALAEGALFIPTKYKKKKPKINILEKGTTSSSHFPSPRQEEAVLPMTTENVNGVLGILVNLIERREVLNRLVVSRVDSLKEEVAILKIRLGKIEAAAKLTISSDRDRTFISSRVLEIIGDDSISQHELKKLISGNRGLDIKEDA